MSLLTLPVFFYIIQQIKRGEQTDMSEESYSKGNIDLLTMFASNTFDRTMALQIIENISDINQPIVNLAGYSSSYLFEAQESNNVDAVRFLLEHGADPNLDIPELLNNCPLCDLHFLWQEMEDKMLQRLEIAKLFFDFGADPNLPYDGESLYDHVLWEVFNNSITPHDWEYIKKFFILLIAYGGGGQQKYSQKPHILEPIDKDRINEYDFKLIQRKDRYHLEGHLFNPDGMDIGIV